MFRRFGFFLTVLLFVLARGASAAPRDKAAQKKIEEAVYEKFLNTDFDAAEGLLLGTIRACEDKCTPALVAKAWMYVGVVRGSGRQDLAGAEDAFTTALQTDPNVALDNETATDPVKAVFAKVKGGGSTAPPASGGAFTCKQSPTEIETRRPVPLECKGDAQVDAATLHYKSFEGEWSTVTMELSGGAFRGTIPCLATKSTGKLHYYVEALAGGKVAASVGKKDQPNTADVVSETTADPPAFPGEEPPTRCGVESTEPAPSAGVGQCGSWGAPCGANDCCENGLSCNAGTCEGKCEADSDCKNGAKCNDGKCEGGSDAKTGPGSKNWVSLSFGVDWASISSDKACDPDSGADHIHCFRTNGDQYVGTPSAAAPGKVTGGLTLATMRLLASYERLFGPIGLEARVGFAFNGGKTPAGGTAFLPVHAELRGKYWLLGKAAFEKRGFRPWVFIGGGVAQVDATVGTQIVNCSPDDKDACVKATSVSDAKARGAGGSVTSVNATKQLGQGFASAGGGVLYAVAKNHGVFLNLSFMLTLPSTGFVIEPSLGYSVGF